MSTYQIACTVGTTDVTAGLGLEIWLDHQQLYCCNQINFESLPLTFDIAEDQADHELRFVMKGKTAEHTVVDSTGAITKDACITVTDLQFDQIELTQLLSTKAKYVHDFNGSGATTHHQFYGVMGCNGTVSLEFFAPVYLWLFEHL